MTQKGRSHGGGYSNERRQNVGHGSERHAEHRIACTDNYNRASSPLNSMILLSS